MPDASREPKLLFPRLRLFYDALNPLSWLLVRFAVGLNLTVHGWGKVAAGAEKMVPAFMANPYGYQHPIPLIYLLTVVEFVGGICIVAGLFTRFFAAAATIEMAVIMFAHYLPFGFSWLKTGYEYVMLWGLVSMAIWWRGGGPYSLDRRIGTEL